MRRLIFAFALAGLLAPAAGAQQPQLTPDERVATLTRQARAIGFALSDVKNNGRYRNAVGMGGKTQMFFRRTDSLTYFARDDRYHAGGRIDVFTGSDTELVARSRRVLSVLGVPATEIARVSVQREFGQAARVDRATGAVNAEPRQLLNRFAVFDRMIGPVPVFSSYARIGLQRSGGVGAMRVHWPAISPATVRAAQVLQARVRAGFQPPEIRGAKPESVAAGIIHSPAAGEVMESVAVIRVIYRPTDAGHGKKPVLYLNLDGAQVPTPRTFLKTPPQRETTPRSAPKPGQPNTVPSG